MDKATHQKLVEEAKNIKLGFDMGLLLEKHGVKEPSGYRCGHCDLGRGTRGMDSCSVCDGTGSVFMVNGRSFPNTEEGYLEASVFKLEVMGHDDTPGS